MAAKDAILNTCPHRAEAVFFASSAAVRLLGAALALAVFAVYANSFAVPFVFDDVASVRDNPSLRSLATAFTPPEGLSVSGRPVANASFALTHFLGGGAVWAHHLGNITVHALAALALFGVVRRTLLHAGRPREATTTAFCAALLWALHPLQTASVTYLMPRTESLAALWLLLTLYAFTRVAQGRAWGVVAVAACALGMATKETMAAAPLLVLLYDRTFVAGSFGAAWRARWKFHAALAATWLVLATLVLATENRGASAGFASGVTWSDYALTQLRAVALYLKLAFWPAPLVFDYGTSVVKSVGAVWPQAVFVAALIGTTLVALWKKPAAGFLGAAFFALLAPSSSVIPVATQTMAEHRMYLPLAVVVIGLVLGLHTLARRAMLGVSVLLAGVLTFLAVQRNTDYRSVLALWRDSAAKYPANARAHFNVGLALAEARAWPESIAEFNEALRLESAHAAARWKLGAVLLETGRTGEAEVQLAESVRLDPRRAEAQDLLGQSLAMSGSVAQALPHFETAARLQPETVAFANNTGTALLRLDRYEEAKAQFERARQLKPDAPEVHFNLGNTFVLLRRYAEAEASYREALRLAPDYAAAQANLERLGAMREGR